VAADSLGDAINYRPYPINYARSGMQETPRGDSKLNDADAAFAKSSAGNVGTPESLFGTIEALFDFREFSRRLKPFWIWIGRDKDKLRSNEILLSA